MDHSKRMGSLRLLCSVGILCVTNAVTSSVSFADEKEGGVVAPPQSYGLPWQLRPAIPVNVVRFDSALSLYKNQQGQSGGVASVNILTASYKFDPRFSALIRAGIVRNEPVVGASATTFTNPILGAVFSDKVAPAWRLTGFFGASLPVGSGGGNYPNAREQAANSAGILARSAMDNSLFTSNYTTLIPGFDVTYMDHGWTIQAEATLFQLIRVRGEQVDKDSMRTNLTTGLSVGYEFIPLVSGIAELRYQRWLSNPTVFGSKEPANHNLSMAIGPRFAIKAASFTARPGIAYIHGLAGPMGVGGYTYPTSHHKVILVDLPFVF